MGPGYGLEAFVSGQVMGFLLVVARLGSALVFMPGFGESYVFARARLALALVICLALYPATPVPPIPAGDLAMVARLMAAEVTVGLWIGLAARAIFTALEFAGAQIGQVSGLANAFGPSLGSFQGATMVATFLLVGGLAAMFATNTHYVIIRALLYSYQVFPFGQPILGDMASQMVKAVQASFYIGLTLAAPFLVMGMILNLGLGLANRMMPNLPVFFVAGSVLIGAGFLILAVAVPSMLHTFMDRFSQWFGSFVF
ncbi:flagellar biosynthesis protein [Defluviimonas sp. 20V17]|uniref:Flagellar biosynthetic protein FliR n=1 Tax=Allgaiera indica TaxID=765699 RepID=A0AAN4UPE8_9RHOB|nr:flagellar biosynthetic protein FliR [Allgaiera indica]KDB03968.1 flagellar biosynthesis protein [Defluviimonas sp. 20V17]GHD99288.1 flagellar biosynthetic protein FliR [Allgaiera indica]SDW29652.1 flagellar biosynthetic protein FliR [Allgaiera indica]